MSIQITLEPQEVSLVLGALAEVPLKHSFDTWVKVKTQAEQQLASQAQRVAQPPAEDAPAE